MTKRPPEKLPDPWLFDSESLLRELDRCRELVLDILSVTGVQRLRRLSHQPRLCSQPRIRSSRLQSRSI